MVLLHRPVNFEWLVGLGGTFVYTSAVGGPSRRFRTLDLGLELISGGRENFLCTVGGAQRRALPVIIGSLMRSEHGV